MVLKCHKVDNTGHNCGTLFYLTVFFVVVIFGTAYAVDFIEVDFTGC